MDGWWTPVQSRVHRLHLEDTHGQGPMINLCPNQGRVKEERYPTLQLPASMLQQWIMVVFPGVWFGRIIIIIIFSRLLSTSLHRVKK
ncbi:hypothetical protein P168DRAFT_292718 [Aspergillus campestris IBT 28561]|uniref:Uncharacterized protein n=1 Tax=Aspergillus campestris (strain IBT 28561) TaxID=1392248 RepID=A0A2I1CVH8_ASPC2|nr:uncharacterized protein P168DRAFT_292718 [Aspergillus campestris IBT 28561]PKY01631.1 hypothetical protein P168DRAFT_292718 [Aspergillus campestris IBT 28561]